MSIDKWDNYFHQICQSIASKSPCLSRKIGAVIVRDNSIISTGYNGPPRGIPHCGHGRFMKDYQLNKKFRELYVPSIENRFNCPRKALGYMSGTHMELCTAQHAEENAVSNAARNGVSTVNTTLYLNSIIPCQKCFGTLINAGISEIVVEEIKTFDVHTKFFIDNSEIEIRGFEN